MEVTRIHCADRRPSEMIIGLHGSKLIEEAALGRLSNR